MAFRCANVFCGKLGSFLNSCVCVSPEPLQKLMLKAGTQENLCKKHGKK